MCLRASGCTEWRFVRCSTWWCARFRRSALFVLEAERGELAAHVVQIESQLSRRETLALLLFVGDALGRSFGHLGDFRSADDHHAVIIGHYNVAWLDPL